MKIIGLIGGMSWESTVPYYRHINEVVKERLGGLHSARLILYSVDFHDIERFQHAGEWEAAGRMLAEAARSLQLAGAEFLVLCTNTMHKVASSIEAAVRIPLLHIADPTALKIREAGYSKVGLLGTRFTMEQGFYIDGLQEASWTSGAGTEVGRPGDWFIGSFTKSCVLVRSCQSRARSTAGLSRILKGKGPRPSFLGARRYRCLLVRKTRKFRCLIPRVFTQEAPPNGRWRWNDA